MQTPEYFKNLPSNTSLAEYRRLAQQWQPPLSGDIDIVIKKDGQWIHEGKPFLRRDLVDLFASLIKREDQDYFLVTPHEKWRITVEDVPFLVDDFDVQGGRSHMQSIILKTATGEVIWLDEAHPLEMRRHSSRDVRPYVHIRQNLFALMARNVYYGLAEYAEENAGKLSILSCGSWFVLE